MVVVEVLRGVKIKTYVQGSYDDPLPRLLITETLDKRFKRFFFKKM